MITRESAHTRLGLTLPEVLIVLAIVVVVLSLAVPAFFGVRTKSRQAAVLASLRTHATHFSSYAQEYQGSVPQLAPAEPGDFTVQPHNFSQPLGFRYMWSWGFWHFALAGKYYDEGVFSRAFYAPGEPVGSTTSYHMSCAFLAVPEYWNPTTRTNPSQWRTMRLDDVQFASSKSLILSDAPQPIDDQGRLNQYLASGVHMAMVDGSASHVSTGRIAPGYFRGDGPEAEPFHQNDGWPLGAHTIDGVRGRDIR